MVRRTEWEKIHELVPTHNRRPRMRTPNGLEFDAELAAAYKHCAIAADPPFKCDLPKLATNTATAVAPNPEDKQTKKKTCFLDLPPELRNDIYFQTTIICPTPIYLSSRDRKCRAKEIEPLLYVNLQVRSEALAIYYGCNTFRCQSEIDVVRFIDSLGDDKLRLLRNVQLEHIAKPLNTAYVVLRDLVWAMERGQKTPLPEEVTKALRLQIELCLSVSRQNTAGKLGMVSGSWSFRMWEREEADRGGEIVWASLEKLKGFVQITKEGPIYRAEDVKWMWEDGELSVRGEEVKLCKKLMCEDREFVCLG